MIALPDGTFLDFSWETAEEFEYAIKTLACVLARSVTQDGVECFAKVITGAHGHCRLVRDEDFYDDSDSEE